MTMQLHSLILRQMRRSNVNFECLSPELKELIQNVSDAYEQFDEDRRMQERSIELSSQEILEALQEAEEANQLKSLFVAKVSHEIRTPMNAILGMAQILLNGELTAEVRECIEIMHISGETLLRLINDLLDFSKIEAGKLDLSYQPFNIHELVDNAQRFLEALLIKESIEMVVHVDDDVPKMILGDKHRLTQIIMNLLSNSVKFNSRGGIIIYVGCHGKTKTVVDLTISVSDSGIGIPEDKQNEIFSAFSQVDGRYNRKYGGTGLGLTISSQLIDLMNGTMELKSKPNMGTRFTINCPFEICHPNSEELSRPTFESITNNVMADLSLKVLVAEDNPVNQLVVKKMLQRKGCQVEVVPDGKQAVEKFTSGTFDLILMDIQMPEVDGYEATEMIRKLEANSVASPIPIVALTAHAMEEEKNKCLAQGMDGFVAKPVDAKLLFNEINKVIKS